MTLALAWVAERSDGRKDLFLASDSRTRGGMTFDVTPKILTLPRSDSAICFAGDVAATFPLMLHVAAAIAAHSPAQDRNLDIGHLKKHLLSVCTDTLNTIKDPRQKFDPSDFQFIFAGYSWRAKDFRIWTFYYDNKSNSFCARSSCDFHPRLKQAAFIGDWAKKYRSELFNLIKSDCSDTPVNCEPLKLLAGILQKATRDDTIGGAPQVVRIGAHMNTRPFCVKWGPEKKRHLFGRTLFDYENCDYWTIDPETCKIEAPKHFRLCDVES
jgi:hypothetical protein